MFSDCIEKLSRKGFGLGTWNEFDKLPSRPDFCYSREKKKKSFLGSFLSDHFSVFNFCPRDGDESGYEEDGRDSSAILVT